MTRRVVDLTDGVAMVVTDLHGNGEAYEAYRDRFLALRAAGQVDRLILCGDLIHNNGSARPDRSLEMLLDVIRLQEAYGAEAVILLLGNHELPHLYSLTLSRGEVDYTPGFEAALSAAGAAVREQVMAFLDQLPFVVRTAAGVLINHCGASPLAAMPGNYNRLIAFDHRALLDRVDRVLAAQDLAMLRDYYEQTSGKSYDEAARYYLAVSGPDDPRYNHLLRSLVLNRSDSSFDLLWDTFFTRNEREHGDEAYGYMLTQYLRVWSAGAPAPQRFLVSGHIPVAGGYAIVCGQQLRLASHAHANPPGAGLYLRLDCASPIDTMDRLVAGLGSAFAP